jgi:hypothetical protein
MKMRACAAAVLAAGAVFAAEQKNAEPDVRIGIYADRPDSLYRAGEAVEWVVKAAYTDDSSLSNGFLEVFVDNFGSCGLAREKVTDAAKLRSP